MMSKFFPPSFTPTAQQTDMIYPEDVELGKKVENSSFSGHHQITKIPVGGWRRSELMVLSGKNNFSRDLVYACSRAEAHDIKCSNITDAELITNLARKGGLSAGINFDEEMQKLNNLGYLPRSQYRPQETSLLKVLASKAPRVKRKSKTRK